MPIPAPTLASTTDVALAEMPTDVSPLVLATAAAPPVTPAAPVAAPEDDPAGPPFLVEHRTEWKAERRSGESRAPSPAARVALAPALPPSGLLAVLPDEAARTLLALLACVTPNGRVRATADRVAALLGAPEAEARARLRRLAATRWRGEPIAHELPPRDSGLAFFVPSRHVVGDARADGAGGGVAWTPTPPYSPPYPPPPVAGGHREAVLAHSRAAYARPRAEVERLVLAQLGHAPEEAEDTPEGVVRRRLAALGVAREQADLLLARHTVGEVADQLDWLPMRGAKDPARFLVAAVLGRYEPPARVRLERAIAAAEAEAEEAEGEAGRDDAREGPGIPEPDDTPAPDGTDRRVGDDDLPPLEGSL